MNKLYDEDVIEITEDDVKVEDVKEEKKVTNFVNKYFDKILLGGLGLMVVLSAVGKNNKNKSINAQNKTQAFMDGYYLGKDSSKNDFNRK